MPTTAMKVGLKHVDLSAVPELVSKVIPGSQAIRALHSDDGTHTRGLRAVDEYGVSTIFLMNGHDGLDDDDHNDEENEDGENDGGRISSAACAILDELLLDHLRSPGHRIGDVRGYAVGVASASALRSRGFFADGCSAKEEDKDGGGGAAPRSPRLCFDEHRGAHSLTCAAVRDGDPACAAVEILERLCPSPPDAVRFEASHERELRSGIARCEVGVMTTPSRNSRQFAMLRDALMPREVEVLRRAARAPTGGLDFDTTTLDSIDHAPVSDARVLSGGALVPRHERRVGTARASSDDDTTAGLAVCEAEDDGGEAHDAEDEALEVLKTIAARLEMHVRELLSEDDAVVTDGFLRRYRVREGAITLPPSAQQIPQNSVMPDPRLEARGGTGTGISAATAAASVAATTTAAATAATFTTAAAAATTVADTPLPQGRRSLPMHFDSLAFATVVIDLDPRAHDGGLAVQSGPHGSTRRVVPFGASGRDAFVHRYHLRHGVLDIGGGDGHGGRASGGAPTRCDAERLSLVLWFARSAEERDSGRAPWLHAAAGLIDDDDAGATDDDAGGGHNMEDDPDGNGEHTNVDDDVAFMMGGILDAGCGGYPRDSANALACFDRAAARGHAPAQAWIGGKFRHEGTPGLAVLCWADAARRGSAVAQSDLAELYLDGLGVSADHGAARLWLTLAAHDGDRVARAALRTLISHDEAKRRERGRVELTNEAEQGATDDIKDAS